MTESVVISVVMGLIVLAYLLWNWWEQEKFEKTELQKAIYRVDQKIGFVEKSHPENFKTKKNEERTFNDITKEDDDYRDYDLLRSAKVRGESTINKEKIELAKEISKKMKGLNL